MSVEEVKKVGKDISAAEADGKLEVSNEDCVERERVDKMVNDADRIVAVYQSFHSFTSDSS